MAELPETFEYTFTCTLPNGIHARPANSLEQIVSGFSSRVSILNLSNRRAANARSILSLVGADIKSGDQCLLKVDGEDRGPAYKEIVRFLEHEFASCDEALPEPPTASGAGWLPPVLRAAGVNVLFGTPVAAGFGRGKIVHAEGLKLPEEIADASPCDAAGELFKLDKAVAEQQRLLLQRLETAGLSAAETGVLNAHLAIVHDVELLDYIRTAIREERLCAGRAVIQAFEHYSAILKTAQSRLIRERILDVQDVCSQLLRNLYGAAAQSAITLTEPSIVVADNLTPSQFIAMDKSLLSGLILLCGGSTSHTVILARSFGIPVLSGSADSDCLLRDHCEAIVDAEYGVLIPEINERVERFYASERRKRASKQKRTAAYRDKPAVTRDGVRLEVMANVATAEEVEAAVRNGADGIGLFRTEMLFMGRNRAPDEEEQYAVYKKAAELADGRPVVIRTFDIGGDKAVSYLNLMSEENPFLGYRGVRLYREFEGLLRAQLGAILRASAYGPLKIMIPMVSCVEQVIYVRGVLEQVKAELVLAGKAFDRTIPLGIMVEIPLAAFIIPQLAEAVDFLSIGTNDLAQYFLAVDRTNDRVVPLYQCRHPGFLSLIRKIADDAHRHDLRVGMCGEMAGQIDTLPLLLGIGLDSVSVSTPFVLGIKAGCSDYDTALCRKMLDQAVACDSAEQVDAMQADRLYQAVGRSVVDVNLVDIDADCLNKEEAIKYAADILFLDRRTDNPVGLEKDFWNREEIYSTGLGHGFAIPHCKTKHIASDSICVFRLRQPVAWGAIDNSPVAVVIAMAIRDTDKTGDTHMKIFSRLARNIMHEAFREKIRTASSKAEMVSFLCDKLGLNDG
jgi:fructose-specific PTS system IIA-like component